MNTHDDLKRLTDLLDAWDPAAGDLPDEVAVALDHNTALRARFDARFPAPVLDTPAAPANLQERVMPRRHEHWATIVVLAAAAAALVAIGASLRMGHLAPPEGAPGVAPGPHVLAEVGYLDPDAAAGHEVHTERIPKTHQKQEGEEVEMLRAVGYFAENEPEAQELERRKGIDPNLAHKLAGLGYMEERPEHERLVQVQASLRKSRVSPEAAPISALGYINPTPNVDLPPTTAAEPPTGDAFTDHGVRRWEDPARDRVSTFSVDVDRGSYSFARRRLREGALPEPASVRTEEVVNALRYDYAPPQDDPFSVTFEASPSPWDPSAHILRVGVQSRVVTDRRPVHLTFLVDTSGSMRGYDRIELVKHALGMLVEGLRDGDTVAIVAYAGAAGVVLEPTADHAAWRAAIDRLQTGGSTAMGEGISLAYRLASASHRPGHTSRVIIASDGDANVGVTDTAALSALIRDHAKAGVALTTLGFGQGNFRDARMEQLADDGDGAYYYIDGLEEARRVFVDDLTSTLELVARDVKVQVVWNPDAITGYRLLGYENREVADRDFRNDAVDAGEVGAGHAVTALYEVQLKPGAPQPIATVHLRHKPPGPDAPSTEDTFPLQAWMMRPTFAEASRDHQLAVLAAAFAEKLRHSPFAPQASCGALADMAEAARRQDHPEDAELVDLMRRAARLGR